MLNSGYRSSFVIGRWLLGFNVRRFGLMVTWKCDRTYANYARLLQAERDRGEASIVANTTCMYCGKHWREHYRDNGAWKMGPYGTFDLTANHLPHIVGVHAPPKKKVTKKSA